MSDTPNHPTVKVYIDNTLGDHVIRADLGVFYAQADLYVSETISDGNGSLLAQLLHRVQACKERIRREPAAVIPCSTPFGEVIFELKNVEIVAVLGDSVIAATNPEMASADRQHLITRINAMLTHHSKMQHTAPQAAASTSPFDLLGDISPLTTFLANVTAELQRPHQPGDDLGKVMGRIFDFGDRGNSGDKDA